MHLIKDKKWLMLYQTKYVLNLCHIPADLYYYELSLSRHVVFFSVKNFSKCIPDISINNQEWTDFIDITCLCSSSIQGDQYVIKQVLLPFSVRQKVRI